MSVINKMLRDLEGRRQGPGSPDEPPVYDDLRPVKSENKSALILRMAAVAVIAVAVGAGAFWVWKQSTSAPVAVAKRVETAVPTPASPQIAESEPAGAKSLTPIAPPANVLTPESRAPQAAPQTQPQAGPAPQLAAAQPPPMEKAPPAPSAPQSKTAPPAAVKTDSAPVKAAKQPSAPKQPKAPVKSDTPKKTTDAASPKPTVRTEPGPKAAAVPGVVLEKTEKPVNPEEVAEQLYQEAGRLVQQGRGYDAEERLKRALESHPQHVRARELLAGLQLRRGHGREAEALLREGMKLVTGHYPFVQLAARMQIERGAEAEALATLEGVRSRYAGNVDYLMFLGTLYQRAARHADAAAAYKDAAGVAPSNARAWLGLAMSLEAQKQTGMAREAYRRALDTGLADPKLIQFVDSRLRALGTP